MYLHLPLSLSLFETHQYLKYLKKNSLGYSEQLNRKYPLHSRKYLFIEEIIFLFLRQMKITLFIFLLVAQTGE